MCKFRFLSPVHIAFVSDPETDPDIDPDTDSDSDSDLDFDRDERWGGRLRLYEWPHVSVLPV